MDRGVASTLQSVVAKQQRAGKKIVDMATGSLLWNSLDIAQTLQKVWYIHTDVIWAYMGNELFFRLVTVSIHFVMW
jgi:hypothetical protein